MAITRPAILTRKVEANALVVRADLARELCEQAIRRYLPGDCLERYELHVEEERGKVHDLKREIDLLSQQWIHY